MKPFSEFEGCLGYSNMWHLEEEEKGKNPLTITIKNTCKILLLAWRLKLSLGKDIDASK